MSLVCLFVRGCQGHTGCLALGSVSVRIQAVWTEACHGFSQSLQENFGIVSSLDYKPFLPNPSQFSIYQLPYQSEVFSLVTDKTHGRRKQEDIHFFLNNVMFIISNASEFHLTVSTHYVANRLCYNLQPVR
jgi:hypothetical protein